MGEDGRRLGHVTFPSQDTPTVQLEGLFHRSDAGGPRPAVVVCHPHPLGGGSMHNGVVRSIARALSDRGVLALRFNFRGVGRSGGEHDNGRAEQADVAGALDWLLSQPGVDPGRIALVGYSFGAWVGLSHAQRDERVTATAAVGLVAWHDETSLFSSGTLSGLGRFAPDFLNAFDRPKLFVTGEYDSFAPPEAIRGLVDRLPPPKEIRIMAGTDHFFGGREAEVGALVADYIAAL